VSPAFTAARSAMIGLGTNVIVRYLAQHDQPSRKRQTELFERQLTVERPGFVSIVAMV
jgi:predicted nucleic-acid-binding protein